MHLNFIKLPDELSEGLSQIKKLLGFEICSDGLKVEVVKGKLLSVSKKSDSAMICYNTKVQFFRALSILLENIQLSCFEKNEESVLKTSGVMLDMSRGGVMHTAGICEYLDYMAAFGLNMLMLYTEDVYELEGKPYFGYMRGRYSAKELKQCDDYAFAYGIEVIPCIQTYSHMEQYLQWPEAHPVTDTRRTMLADSEDTYEFIDSMVEFCASTFRSKRIHVGLDESQDMLTGAYLKRFGGGAEPCEVFKRHTKRVIDIARKYDLKPMMWSDMFFRLNSSDGNSYYEADDVCGAMVEGIDCVYWNYDGDAEVDRKMIDAHRKANANAIFAGRIHTTGPIPNNTYAINTIENSFEALIDKHIEEAFVTIWSNDGGETDYRYCLPALCAWSENTYSSHRVVEDVIKSRFEYITGADYEAFIKMSEFQNCFTDNRPLDSYVDITQGKRLLYQDPLLGFLDDYLSKYPLSNHYRQLEEYLSTFVCLKNKWQEHYEFAWLLSGIMKLKCLMSEKLKTAYEACDEVFLKSCVNDILPQIIAKSKRLRELYRKQWFSVKKAQGYEMIDMRVSHLYVRAESAIVRLNDYLDGKVDYLEELEEDRLPFPKFKYNFFDIASAYRP